MTISENMYDNQIVCTFDCGYRVVYDDLSVKDAANQARVDHRENCSRCMDKGDTK